jgi:hypothetical protein
MANFFISKMMGLFVAVVSSKIHGDVISLDLAAQPTHHAFWPKHLDIFFAAGQLFVQCVI